MKHRVLLYNTSNRSVQNSGKTELSSDLVFDLHVRIDLLGVDLMKVDLVCTHQIKIHMCPHTLDIVY